MFFICFYVFPKGFVGPGWFKKVREVGRIHFHQVSCKTEGVGASYDQKTEIPLFFLDLLAGK